VTKVTLPDLPAKYFFKYFLLFFVHQKKVKSGCKYKGISENDKREKKKYSKFASGTFATWPIS